jgi:hypothetical protein
MILIVVWNRHGFPLIDILAKGSKFNAGHYIYRILSPISEILASYQDYSRRYFVIHADNVRPHCVNTIDLLLDHNFLRRASHLPYSPDMPPQTFGFLYLRNECFKGVHSTNLMNFFRYPGNFEGNRSWDFVCDISRMSDPIAKQYWWKWWICWVMFKLKCSIPFLNGKSWDTRLRWKTLCQMELFMTRKRICASQGYQRSSERKS